MASTAEYIETNKPNTERGHHAHQAWAISLDAAQSFFDCEMDTVHIGGVSILFFINNLNTNLDFPPAQLGAKTTLEFTLQFSADRVNWTNAAAWKNQAGTETATGAAVVQTQNTTQYVIVNIASYPEAAGVRFWRLHVRSGTAAISYASVYACLK